MGGLPNLLQPADVVWDEQANNANLSARDVAEMPDELRSICEVQDEFEQEQRYNAAMQGDALDPYVDFE